MAAPEAPLCYVGVARQSASFHLMKQMVLHFHFLLYLFICVFLVTASRGWKKGKDLGRTSKGLKDLFESRTSKIPLTVGVGLEKEKPNNWAFDTTQFDNILKRLNVQAAQQPDEEAEEKKPTQVESEAELSTHVEEPVVKVRPQGRYKKREKGKRVHAYSSKDLEGILVKRSDDSNVTNSSIDSQLDAEKASKSQFLS